MNNGVTKKENITQSSNRTDNLKTFKNFLKCDIKIKEILIRLAPHEVDDWNEESRIEYINKLYNGLNQLKNMFLSSVEKFEFGPVVNKAIIDYFEKASRGFLIGKYESGICQKMYASQFACMNEKFIENVKEKFVGYSTTEISDLVNVVNKAATVNELLHAIHSYIINNENILQSMPIIGHKENIEGEDITLYGEENDVAQRVFNEFPLEMDCGITDIVSFSNEVFMMVRDRGHALMIDLNTLKPDDVEVRYFIPKLCNEDMIRQLPGINRSSITENGATGFFISDKKEITKRLFDFIEKVPMDSDMVWNYSDLPINERKNSVEFKNKSFNENEDKLEQTNFQKDDFIFNKEDVQEMVMQKGKSGRKISKIELIMNKVMAEIKKQKTMRFGNKDKEVGDD